MLTRREFMLLPLVATANAQMVLLRRPRTIAAAGITLVSQVTENLGFSGGTTSAIDTTGATLLIAAISYYDLGSGVNLSDSKSNTWTLVSPEADEGYTRMAVYVATGSITVGSGHTVTQNGGTTLTSVSFSAWSGTHASPVDQENEGVAGAGSSTIQPGSITPTQDGSLVICAVAFEPTSNPFTGLPSSDDASMSLLGEAWTNTNGFGITVRYKIQATAAAINPTVTYGDTCAKIAAKAISFLPV
jgi:hypothetical protein